MHIWKKKATNIQSFSADSNGREKKSQNEVVNLNNIKVFVGLPPSPPPRKK